MTSTVAMVRTARRQATAGMTSCAAVPRPIRCQVATGRDDLSGELAADVLHGGAGDDSLSGGMGSDELAA